ncbi:DNA adenine methylase [Nocardioides aquiterrae]|uniref:site-specific DNA-methyltransferase (adenine-specific) n=1 Tax=Nocardioides aquiterrae TaxID=203799 RepID=A0ABN1UAR8_9ACTN
MRFLSPLRYPGGKAKMSAFLREVIELQDHRVTTYAEPYAGGAGAALYLLSQGVVGRIALNDLNIGVAGFWNAVFRESTHLCKKIESVEPTLAEWHRQREIYLDEASGSFDRGFATFFLNRTNRSGILGARPIGGLEQTGKWKIDARYNRKDLVDRIEFLAGFSSQVSITSLDGRKFIQARSDDEHFFYVDPPYLKQGEDLYLSNMTYADHLALARTLHEVKSPWVLTYDLDDRVPDQLYAGMPAAAFTVSHTAASQHVGGEYLIAPHHVRIDTLEGFGPRPGRWLDGRSPTGPVRT